ncbi:MAG: hypothetical protein N7Q72_01670 [Spiroplasma sp. Tabriz.8]|nr:hypothetical protein [Candidatus Regiella insecticola]MCZ8631951.1 hypothetical protein [Spiroplasma sp. Tabriz.8]
MIKIKKSPSINNNNNNNNNNNKKSLFISTIRELRMHYFLPKNND